MASILPDFQLAEAPDDPVSALAFTYSHDAQKSGQLLVASWDKLVRLYDLSNATDAGAASLVHSFLHEAAVLDVCWINDSFAASGGLDRRVRLLNLQTGQSKIIGKHEDAISRIRFCPQTGLLLSAGWDRTLKVWDALSESPKLLHTLQLPEKVLAMDLSPPFPLAPAESRPVSASADGGKVEVDRTPRAVVGMTGRSVYVYELDKLRAALDRQAAGETVPARDFEPEQKRESSLKFMIRDIRCMPAGDGYATSSVEGRVAVEFFDPSSAAQAKKYAFKCHRQTIDGIDTVYPVNGMAFHPVHGTFASIGGDAVCSIWDAAAKKRIRQYPRLPSPLSAVAFSSDGTRLVVASGGENIEETSSAGASGAGSNIGPGGPGNVRIHVKPAWEDCKPKVRSAPA